MGASHDRATLVAPTLSRRARRSGDAPSRVGDRNEAALLEAARDLLERREFNATPIRHIAQRAGISRQGFYFYFTSKDELLMQLVNDTLYASQPWRTTLYEHGTSRPADAVREIVTSTVGMWRTNRDMLVAMVETSPRTPAFMEQWVSVVEESAEFIADLVVAASDVDDLRDRTAARRALVSVIWMFERNCYVHFVGGSKETDADLADRLSALAARALGMR